MKATHGKFTLADCKDVDETIYEEAWVSIDYSASET